MRPISEIAKMTELVLRKNSPAILTGFGVAGVVSTAVLSVKATFKAADDIVDEYYRTVGKGVVDASIEEALESVPFKDAVRVSWKRYIPPTVTGAVSIGCIIGSNRISNNRAAALVTAYSLTEKAFAEYKDKVVEQIGANKEQKVRDDIAQDRVNKTYQSSETGQGNEVIFVGTGEVLFCDLMTNRYFRSTKQKIENAENVINRQILHEMYASLNDFWREIGIETSGFGEEVGWNIDTPLELQFSATTTPDGNEPCLAIGYRRLPIQEYHKIA